MLTIRSPIAITADASILTCTDSFADRITANYQVMAAGMELEDMLHMIASPPEIYLAQGGMASFVNQENRVNRQELKVSLIHNVLNRILVSENVPLTYQDQVFVQNVLSRIGITDVKEFMRQVRKFQQDTKQLNELIDLYWINAPELVRLKELRVEKEGESGKAELTVFERELLQRLLLRQDNRYAFTEKERTWLEQLFQRIGITDMDQWLLKTENYRQDETRINELIDRYWADAPAPGEAGEPGEEAHRESGKAELTVSERELLQQLLLRQDNQYAFTEKERNELEHLFERIGITDMDPRILKTEDLSEAVLRIEERLTDLQLQNRTLIRDFQTERAGQEAAPGQTVRESRERERLWLHQKIMNRLETGAVYQELEQFFSGDVFHNRVVEGAQMQIGEQAGAARYILLNHLQNLAFTEEQPLTYHRINVYELGREEGETRRADQASRDLAAAVVLHVANQLYTLEFSRLSQKKQLWYELRDVLYQGAANVLERFENYHILLPVTRRETEAYREQVRERHDREIQALEQLSREEETAFFELERTTEQNRERIERAERLYETLPQPGETVVVERKKAMQDALRAMEEPGKVLMEYRESERERDERTLLREKELREVLDERALQTLELLERYQRSPQMFPEGMIRAGDMTQLVRDVSHNRLRMEREELVSREETSTEHLPETVRRMVREETAPGGIQQTSRRVENAAFQEELLYRQEETGLSEEVLQELQSISRNVQTNLVQTRETVQETHTMQETLTNRVNEMHVQKDEEIARMIADHVRRQIDGVSERVYNQIARRMDTERRRRGM